MATAKERKQELATETSNLRVEFSIDDELIQLVTENTHGNGRVINNILRCLTLIAGGSSLTAACKLTGITLSRLNYWRSKEWYARAIELIRQRLDEQLDGKMTHAVNHGLARVQERLERGDAVVNSKTGEITYKPVSARDAAIITSIFFDKRNLLRNKPTSIHSTQSTDERLQLLASKFKEIAVDAEYVELTADADYEEVYTDTDYEEDTVDVKRLEEETNSSTTASSGKQLGVSLRSAEGEEADTPAWQFTDT